jgi:predicted RND superfamily exporter protein
MVVLPALVVLHGRWRVWVRRGRSGPPPRREAWLARVWVERASGWICRFPRGATVAALLATVALAWAGHDIRLDTNILDLLPRSAESVAMQRRMVLESSLTPVHSIALADGLEALREMRRRAEAEPTIARFESVLQFLPETPDETPAAIEELGAVLGGIRLPNRVGAVARERLVASLRRLEAALEEAADAAFTGGHALLAAPLEEARAEAESVRRTVQDAPAGAEKEWGEGQRRLLRWARDALDGVRGAMARKAPTTKGLPQELRSRFMTGEGHFVAYIHPSGDAFDPHFLEEYVDASRRVSSEATGFPIVFHRMSQRLTNGFFVAVVAGTIAVFLLLLVDLRSLRHTALAMVPLVMGVLWMVGAMRLLGLSFNFANLVAVPLVIGVGIDNGVHIMHRIRLEGSEGMHVVVRHTGRAILIASLTTMIGFGSLSLASHRGLASLGMVLLLGVGSCLATSTLVLPNLLIALRMVRK